MIRRLAGVLVFVLILPPFMVLACGALAAAAWRWFRTGDSQIETAVLAPSLLNWITDLPGRVGGWSS